MHLLITLVIFFAVACVLLYVVRLLLGALPGAPKPIYNVFYALAVLLLLCLFLSEMGWLGAPHAWRHWP